MHKVIRRVTSRGLSTFGSNGSISSSEVRKRFLDYFQCEHGHVLIPSSPVVSIKDKTTPFVNSGMFQFKDVFLGLEFVESPRVVNSQKCIRVNPHDTEMRSFGNDGIRHTFFEMLGNWSFGDYYKKEACQMSWRFLTEHCGISPDRLYVTYFNGDEELGIGPDLETPEIWAEIGVPRNRILPFGKEDNFWKMSSEGPCGPSTEIHCDLFPGKSDVSHLVNANSPLVLELWNLVFMEYNRTADGKLERLDRHYVDTGMGFERLVSVLQRKASNYETDIFLPLYEVIRKKSGCEAYTGSYDGNSLDVGYRILADHSRLITVALSDGACPRDRNKLKAALRRAFDVSWDTFHVHKGLILELSKHVVESLCPVYPELAAKADVVEFIIQEEEKLYGERRKLLMERREEFLLKHPEFREINEEEGRNLKGGFYYLKKVMRTTGSKVIDGNICWKLFDTYGISKQGIKGIAKVLGLKLDEKQLEESLSENVKSQTAEFYDKYNASWSNMSEFKKELPGGRTKMLTDYLKAGDVTFNAGGDCVVREVPAKIIGIFRKELCDRLFPDDTSYSNLTGVVFDQTNFLLHTDNFTGDTGLFQSRNLNLVIKKARQIGKNIIHFCCAESLPESNSLEIGEEGRLYADSTNRTNVISNSTAFLLFSAVLQDRYKTFSIENYDISDKCLKLKFRAYGCVMTESDVMELEKRVNELIKRGGSIKREICKSSEARGMKNFIAMTGQTFIDPDIPVCTLRTDDFCYRFYWPHPVHEELSMTKRFMVTGSVLKKTKFSWFLKASSGKKALDALQCQNEALERWLQLKDLDFVEFQHPKVVDKRLRNLQSILELFLEGNCSFFATKPVLQEIKMKIRFLKEVSGRLARSERRIERKSER